MQLISWDPIKKKNSYLEENIINISYGEHDALVALYEETKSAVYGFALSILKNQHDAEDILQEVYIKIYEKASSYEANGKPLAWILTITKNLSYMKLRSHKDTTDIHEIQEFLKIDNKDHSTVENKLLLSFLFQYISDEERNILMLHAISGFKYHEIAKLLNLPLSTVLSKYHRAIKKIKTNMNKEDIHDK